VALKRIVITGALGHIGSRLIHGLEPGQFRRVLLLDNLLTQRYASLYNLPAGVPFDFREADICTEDLGPLFDGADAVIHLAAITNAAASFENQQQVEAVNFQGTRRVAEACARAGARLLFLSTTSVYGVSEGVVGEDCPPEQLKPQSPYAESKLRSEHLLADLAGARGLRYVACRFGTIYGVSVGMRFHTAINKFVWQACLGQPLTVWRTALDQKRPYLDLGDAVRAIRFILDIDRFDNQVYNVLTDNATVRQITDLIREEVPELRIKLVDAAIMNQLSYTVANDRFRALGFAFQGDLARGIRQTVALLRSARCL
jgi:nucleoside-diphosphate-sugar epimerase